MTTTLSQLELLGFLAPLLEDSEVCVAQDYTYVLELPKNKLTQSLYAQIMELLSPYVVRTEDEYDAFILYLMDIDTYLYSALDLTSISTSEAEMIVKQLLNSATYNTGNLIHVDADLFNTMYFCEYCFSLLGLQFIRCRHDATTCELCPYDGMYHACNQVQYLPANMGTYATIRQMCDYPIGLAPETTNDVNELALHSEYSIQFNAIFNYALVSPEARPPKISHCGFDLHAVSIDKIEGNFITLNTGLYVEMPMREECGYHFKIGGANSLVSNGFVLMSPTIVIEPSTIKIVVQRMSNDAILPEFPFVVAHMLISANDAFLPVQISPAAVEEGTSN